MFYFQILTKPRFTQDPHGVAGSLLQSLTSDSSTVPNGSLVSNGRCESNCEEKCTCASGYRSILRSYSRTSVSSCDHFGTDNGAVVRTAILGTKEERSVLFNNALNTFYWRLYGVGHMVKDHSDSEKGNPLPPHGLLFPISSKGSFICIIPLTG